MAIIQREHPWPDPPAPPTAPEENDMESSFPGSFPINAQLLGEIDSLRQVPNQYAVIEELENIGVNFPSREEGCDIISLDPDRFYIAFIRGDIIPKENFDNIGKFFKKGGILFLNKKDEARDYSIEDLKSMKDGITTLLNMIEKKNKVSHTRFDIIKGDT